MNNPYQTPSSDFSSQPETLEYVGFWPRVGAALIDSIAMMIVTMPLVLWIYGLSYFEKEGFIVGPADFVVNYVLPAIVVITFWIYKSATPGKMAVGARIVDAKTGNKPSNGQLIGRYLGYYISLLPLGLGIFWVAWDAKKQGWHDKLAGTVVIRSSGGNVAPVSFDKAS